jgi:hypothetical protein
MTNLTFVTLKTRQKQYLITIKDYSTIIESPINCLLNKTPTELWKWARIFNAKVYYNL